MASTDRPTSTLSAAINSTVNEFTVASTANITVGCYLAFNQEFMKVVEVPVSGRVKVRRGVAGTHSLAHASGDTFYIGTPDQFDLIRNESLGLFGQISQLPKVCVPGARAFDANGYEYILIDLTETVVPGATVLISKDGLFTGSVLTASGSGPVGIVVENATSDQWAWVLIRGYYAHAKLVGGSSLATSTGVMAGASSVSTPSVGLRALTTSQAGSSLPGSVAAVIQQMYPAGAASTASTSASSETGLFCAVWLEYPFIPRRLSS